MIKVSAPGRCGLVGNPTDMYGGSVVSCSTREHAFCVLDAAWGGPGVLIQVSGVRQRLETQGDLVLRGDHLDIVRGVLSALDVDPANARPFSLDVTTDIPMCAGLAGSTAMIATVVGAVLSHIGLRLNLYETAELIRKIEYDVLEIVCGFQDHYMCVFGGLNYMDFRDKSSDAAQDPGAPFATVEPLEPFLESALPIVVAHTGDKHHSGDVHSPLRARWLEGEKTVVDGHARIARLARLAKKAILAGQWEVVGTLMNQNHEIVRDLGCSSETNETLIAAALGNGAIGAKLAGAGGGGSIVVVSYEPERTVAALTDAGADAIVYPAPSPGLTVEILV
ncbi:MAG: hypothetical protein P4L33_18440 [Capsulimonadaceae bacterium]|nr:hypothetical protein [Capsulimonadaceae bacterium]